MRQVSSWTAAAVVSALAGTAFGQALTIDAPVLGNVESAGNSTIIQVDVPAGADGANNFLIDTENLIANLYVLNSTGTAVLVGPVTGTIVGGPIAYANGAGNANVQVNITGANFGGNLVAGNILLLNFTTATTAGEGPDTALNINGLSTVVNTADEALDTSFAVDATIPTLQSVILNTGGTQVFFVFSERLNTGAAVNDINQSVVANIDGNDFQVDTTSSFDGTEVAPTNLSNTAIIGTTSSIIRMDRAAGSTLNAGTFVRAAFNNAVPPVAQHQIFDMNRNQVAVSTTGVAATTAGALSLSSAEVIASLAANGAGNQNIRVIFNNPLGDGGQDASYQVVVNGVVSTTLVPVFDSIDPNNPNAVLLDINANSGEGISSDGRTLLSNGAATGAISIRVNGSQANDPTDLFGTDFAGESTVAAADKIAPSLMTTAPFGAGNSVAFVDTNRNGEQDGVLLAFDEPISDVTSTTGLQLTRNNGIPTRPFFNLSATMVDLPTAVNTVTSGTLTSNIITPAAGSFSVPSTGTGVSRVDVDADKNGTITDRERNSGILVTCDPRAVDWDNDTTTRNSATPDANEPVPDTGAANAMQFFLNPTNAAANNPASGQSIGPVVINDANGNAFTNGGAVVNEDSSVDFAAPVVAALIFTAGDNQGGANNDQLFAEQGAAAGDDLANDRFTFVFGEALNEPNTAGVAENFIFFGPGGSGGAFTNDAAFVFGNGGATGNLFAVANSAAVTSLMSSTPLSFGTSADIDDGANNAASVGDTVATPQLAPYVTLQVPVGGGAAIHAAYLFDADALTTDAGFGFADTIRLTMSQALNTTGYATTDFTLNNGATVIGVSASGGEITITITDGVIPMTSLTTTVTYNAASDANRIQSTGGVAVSTTGGGTVTAQAIPDAFIDTPNPAIMDIYGTITVGSANAPVGTKVYAMIAAPVAASVTATHNNASFTRRLDDGLADNVGSASLVAFTNWLLGLHEFVYLHRDENNSQPYRNSKIVNGLDSDNDFAREVIQLVINASNLSSITFTGTGEVSTNKVTNGRVRLGWDVLRSANGTIQSFYSAGFVHNGQPIVSSTVTTDSSGRYELHVSGPISSFDGLSRLSSVGRPVILVVELPSGERFAASSLVSSVKGGPILFNPQNRTQTTGVANPATEANVNLDNIAREAIYTGWNLVPFNRQGGFANTAGNRPIRVAQVDEGEIVVPSASAPLPVGAGPLDQFVMWREAVVDGKWLANDDAAALFDSIVVDTDLFPNFAFTMTSFGVQAGSSINNLVGGYACGFFNPGTVIANLGVFQFGVPFTTNVLFSSADAATTFPNNATTQGWGLFSSKTGYNPATTAQSATTNPDLDYIFYFRNNGPNAAAMGLNGIEVQSLDLDPEGTENDPQDLSVMPAGQAFFGHFIP